MFEDRIATMNAETETIVRYPAYEKRVYTVDEVQDILGVSKTSAYNLVKSGAFHCVKVGGQYRVFRNTPTMERFAEKLLPLPGVPKIMPLGVFSFLRSARIMLPEVALSP